LSKDIVKTYVFSNSANEPVRESLSLIFGNHYINPKRLFNGKDLLRIKDEYDIVVLYDLPGDTALNLLRRLREKIQMPVFLLSTRKEADLILRAFKLGAKDFFVAPFNLREIDEKIKESIPRFCLRESKVELAKRYMEANFRFNMRLGEIARAIGCTQAHLVRTFHSRFKITPHAYLMNLRLDAAKEYLLNTNYPLSEICKLTGFYCAGHLCREFKKQTNATPLSYRQKYSKIN
jgi:AraC-like DNA-binding protein